MGKKLTAGEVLEEVDSLKPNTIEERRKKEWIEELELLLQEFREGFEEEETGEKGLEEEGTGEEGLSVSAPYNEVYRYYLESKIDYANGEIEKYNNSRAMFNNALNAYENHYRRHHMPKGQKLKLY